MQSKEYCEARDSFIVKGLGPIGIRVQAFGVRKDMGNIMDTRVILGFIGGSYQHHGPGFCNTPFFSFSGVSRFLMKQGYTQHELLLLDSRVGEDPSCY